MPYTSGEWFVKPGLEDEFVRRWRALAEWTLAEVPGATWAKLLRDRAQPNRFVSFGPWEDDAAIEAWRAHPGFGDRVGSIREVLESFAPRTLDAVVEVG
jgi:heme-degrading monooxygenase HmoA